MRRRRGSGLKKPSRPETGGQGSLAALYLDGVAVPRDRGKASDCCRKRPTQASRSPRGAWACSTRRSAMDPQISRKRRAGFVSPGAEGEDVESQYRLAMTACGKAFAAPSRRSSGLVATRRGEKDMRLRHSNSASPAASGTGPRAISPKAPYSTQRRPRTAMRRDVQLGRDVAGRRRCRSGPETGWTWIERAAEAGSKRRVGRWRVQSDDANRGSVKTRSPVVRRSKEESPQVFL